MTSTLFILECNQCPDTSENEPPRRTFNHEGEYERCRERYVNYVLNADTPFSAIVMFQDIEDTRTPRNGGSGVFPSSKLPTSLGAKVVSTLIP